MEEKLTQLRTYLTSKYYKKRTIKNYESTAKRFLEWLKKNGYTLENLTYAESLQWVGWRQGQGVSSRTINYDILTINHLYKSQNQASPLEELRLRGLRHESKNNTISYKELEGLYEVYNESGAIGKRNKVILGILIYQGLKRIELERMRMEDVDLENGLIRVRETGVTNSRILKLEAVQILALSNYVYQVRPELNKKELDYLFVSKGKGNRLGNILGVIWRSVSKHYGMKLSAKEVRQSLITHWIKTKEIREVQYMAGHRNVSSTFKYGESSLEDLLEEIERVHPLSNFFFQLTTSDG